MPKLIWIDIETSGLDPNKDTILEVAVMVSDFSNPFDIHPLYHAVLNFNVTPPEPIGYRDGRPYKMDGTVWEMHTKNGLFSECSNSKLRIEDAEKVLLDLIPEEQDRKERPILAGSTVHFDRSFLKVHMPTLEQRFIHRHFDVSSIKLLCQSLGMREILKAEAHRAKDDILESVAHAKGCTMWLSTRCVTPG